MSHHGGNRGAKQEEKKKELVGHLSQRAVLKTGPVKSFAVEENQESGIEEWHLKVGPN